MLTVITERMASTEFDGRYPGAPGRILRRFLSFE